MLCEAPQGENEGFDLAGSASSCCFNCRFVLEEEFSWVGVSIVLQENSRVETWRPLELLELHQKRDAKASLVWLVLLLHPYVLAFLFIEI